MNADSVISILKVALPCVASLLLYTSIVHPGLIPRRKVDLKAKYGEWAMVVGASKGLGASWSRALAKRGMNLVLIARSKQDLEALARNLSIENGIQVEIVVQDLSNTTSWRLKCQEIAQGKDIGLVVYNAAQVTIGRHLVHTLSTHLSTVRVNIDGVLAAVDAFVPPMRARKRGAVILMSSVTGQGGAAIHANYGAIKAWNSAFAEALWAEVREDKVDVLGVILGVTSTPTLDEVMDPNQRQRMFEANPDDVVSEALNALGHGPIVICGLVPKIACMLMWLLPPKTRASVAMVVEKTYKQGNELKAIAERNASAAGNASPL